MVFLNKASGLGLIEKLTRQNEYLSSLHETALALLERRDVNTLLETILRRAAALAGTQHAYIFLADDEAQILRLAVGAGIYANSAGRLIKSGEGLIGKVFFTARPQSINNCRHSDGCLPEEQNARVCSIVAVPLLAAGRTIGVLGVSNAEAAGQFGPDEVELFCRFGELASIALDNAYLHQALQKELDQRKAIERELRYISAHDPLTSLLNRSCFELELRCKFDKIASVIICDVDGLKLINDSMGHQRGDMLLIAAAEIIRQAAPLESFAARIGGDEFAIILYDTDEIRTEQVCQKIRQLVEERSRFEPEIPLSISTGYAVGSGGNEDLAKLYKEADDSMYREKLHRSQSVRSTIVQALLKALEVRDFITEGHAERMQELAVLLGGAAGLSKRTLGELRLIAQFHDIGKVGIPDRILFKPDGLTDEEYIEMKRHCEIGHRIALSTPDLAPIAKYILHHHEWWNGQGYPLGLKGNEIPLECRVIAIADAYDAMTSNRPYRKSMEHSRALTELMRCSGKQFDPWLVAIFVSNNGFASE